MINRRMFLHTGAAAAAFAATARSARAENAPGVTDSEIRIGQTMPYSGPASAYGIIGKTALAYFRMINEAGGVNGRKINLISLDDGYSPPKTVEQVRRLAEDEKVAFFFNTLGTAPNLAIRQYLNDNRIPQLFVATGASVFSDPEHFPWTMGYNPSYRTEGRIYAKDILKTKPDGKIAVLYQNDGFGKEYVAALHEILGPDHGGMIVKEASYETSEPTIDSQVVTLQGSGADIFLIAATPKFAAQAIRKSADLGWNATRYVSNVSVSIATVLKPAGLEKSKGLITSAYVKDPTDESQQDDPGVKAWRGFTDKFMTAKDFIDVNAVYAFGAAQVMAHVLKQCGNDLSRDNVMKQAASIKDLQIPILLNGMTVNTSPTNFSPIRQMQLARFEGESWRLYGELVEG